MQRHVRDWSVRRLGAFLIVLAFSKLAVGAGLQEAQRQFLSGDYAHCLALARAVLAERESDEDWQLWLSRALLAGGRYEEAQRAMSNALSEVRWSIRLRWQAREVFLSNGQTEAARGLAESIVKTVSEQPRSFRDAPNLVVFGQAALQLNADPKKVLDTVFEAARKDDPKCRDVYLASGQLALDKHDFALAAKHFQAGLKQLPDDPDLNFGLARAYAPSDPALMLASLEAALAHNTNHVGCLLLLTDYSLDGEDYAQAEKLLDRIDQVNPSCPDAWAYRAVLAHLQNRPEGVEIARKKALEFWSTNPQVDYLLGHKLSQYYRFAEGAACQRKALQFDPGYLPAKAQLAEDLLRLGEEQEGWRLAEEVQQQDGYDVEAFNLAALHDTMGKFAALTNQDFIVRLSRHEASVYGARVLDLLERARSNLCAKYGMEVKQPTLVEVFSEQKDFAVRTFGMPGNPGYLGVSFGSVITATGPAAHSAHAVNWQSVLWHEFCHVVTLQMTRNKMPRWLSEGISVYEERQAAPAWGQRMTPRYREMVLGGDLKPVSKLSAAFLAPRSELHLQFAYYESSLVVEFLVQRFGLGQLKAILRDLGEGLEINQALARHTVPMETFEAQFAAFAREKADNLAPGLDWERPARAALPGWEVKGPSRPVSVQTNGPADALIGSNEQTNPSSPAATNALPNFWRLSAQAQQLVEQKEWSQAKMVLERLAALCPGLIGDDSPLPLLAYVHKNLGETNAERQVVARIAENDDDALDAYGRLIDLDTANHDWQSVALNANRYLQVNPLAALPYRALARAAEELNQSQTAIAAYRTLLELDPADPANVHYRLARLLQRSGDPEARRQILQALEEAPRFRDALRLLLEIEKGSVPAQPGGT